VNVAWIAASAWNVVFKREEGWLADGDMDARCIREWNGSQCSAKQILGSVEIMIYPQTCHHREFRRDSHRGHCVPGPFTFTASVTVGG